jgi:hypothetical protein
MPRHNEETAKPLGPHEDEIVDEWDAEDEYWRTHWQSRPSAAADRTYEFYQPGYRYGFESARRFRDRTWNEVEAELRVGWDRYKHRGQVAWESIKGAVKDAFDRVRS